MRKNPYRPAKLEATDVEALIEQCHGSAVILATDVAKKGMVTAVELTARQERPVALLKWEFPNEFRTFLSFVVRLQREAGSLVAVQESSGTYGDPLREALQASGVDVRRVSAKHVHDVKEFFDGTPSKNDGKDARLIAHVHRLGRSTAWPRKTDGERDVKAAQRVFAFHGGRLQRCLGQLEALLARHWPEYQTLWTWDCSASLKLLGTYGSPQVVHDCAAEARELLGAARGVRTETATRLMTSCAQTAGVPCSPEETVLIQTIADEALKAKEAKKKAARRLAELTNDVPEVRQVAAVAGPATAPALFVLLGSTQEYSTAKAYLKAPGLNLREFSSGQRQGPVSISRRGPSEARRLLFLLALRLIQTDPVIRAWYDRKVARDGGRTKKKAVVAVMRKVTAALWHVGRGATFDSRRLFDTTQLALPKAA